MAEHAATASPAEPLLLQHVEGGVATLTLNRPRQYNALSGALVDALQSALDGIGADASVRVVVIAGNGAAFCSGHDLKEMQARRERPAVEDLFRRCARMMTTLTRIPQPVIARVHGIATAAGCQLVAQCDLAVAAETATFATSGVNLGLFCATPGVAVSRNVGRKQAMEMLLTGDFLDARTALDQGLLNRVVPQSGLDAAVRHFADAVLRKSPVAIATGKRMFYRQLEMGMEDAYAYAAGVITDNFLTADACEGIDAFFQKRPPQWQGR